LAKERRAENYAAALAEIEAKIEGMGQERPADESDRVTAPESAWEAVPEPLAPSLTFEEQGDHVSLPPWVGTPEKVKKPRKPREPREKSAKARKEKIAASEESQVEIPTTVAELPMTEPSETPVKTPDVDESTPS